MQEAEEQDTCRICSAPAEPDQPLFHPCKCSGTIRYIHQDCLTTWLAHSKKKTCDVCKHPYSFTKVYAPDMPSRLPTVLLARRLSQHAFFGLLFVLRAIAVAIIWLAVLPWVTVWTWRMYFSMGESTAWYISNLDRPVSNDGDHYYHKLMYGSAVPPPKTFIGRITAHPVWIALSADIFTGQIIASLIVLTFVAVFLLREWISQNARPGVFEDEEVFPDMPPVVNDPPQQPVPAPQVLPAPIPALPDPAELEQRQQDAMQALERMRTTTAEARRTRETNGEGRERDRIETPGHGSLVRGVERERKEKRLRRLDSGSDEDEDGIGLERIKRRTHAPRVPGSGRVHPIRRRGGNHPYRSTSPVTYPSAVENPDRVYPFTFQAPTPDPLPGTSSPSLSNSLGAELAAKLQSVPVRRPPLPTSVLSASGRESPFMVSPSRSPLGSPSLATYCAPEELNAEAGPSRLHEYFNASTPELRKRVIDSGPQKHQSLPFIVFDSSEKVDDEVWPRKARRGSLASSPLSEGAEQSQRSLDAHRPRLPEPSHELPRDDEELGPAAHQDLSVLPGDSSRDHDNPGGDAEDTESDFDFEAERGKYFAEVNGIPQDTPPDARGETPDLPPEAFELEREAEMHREDDEEEEEEVDEDADGLFWPEANWDGIELERVPEGQEPDGDGNPAPDANPAPANGRIDADAAADAGLPPELDDLEGNVEDDMEGAMEAIGMRGPIYGVFQNAALMIFVLDTAIGLGIWIPFTVGKCVALLSLNPRRVVQILHLPIKLIRIVTDPEVDFIIFLVNNVLIMPYRDLIKQKFSLFVDATSFLVKNTLGEERLATCMHFTNWTYTEALHLLNGTPSPVTGETEAVSTEVLLGRLYTYLGPAEPYFALLGKEVRLGIVKFKDSWYRMAVGSGPTGRVFAIGLGYAVVGLFLALYLNILTVGNARSATRAVRNAVRQQLLVIKVAAFIFIELVLFPLGCGIILDLCTVWLFPEANLQSRIAFFAQAPLTAMFYHWIAGTMFMYSFAVLLSGCRTIMRPGAMWFIKDPQDQNSHPIRDILDRPTLTQLRKICMSGVMYSIVVACVVGSVAGLLVLGNKSILPFRWKNREPLSNIPIDLLFLHLVLPYTMHYFRPKRAIKRLATAAWKYLAKKLRLTSYFFGDRRPEEEYTPQRWFGASINDPELSSRRDGTFRRVPATDNLALPRDMRATARVTDSGDPFDDEAADLIKTQNAEALKAKRDINTDYRVVYIPPGFRYRIFAFISSMWVTGAVVLGISVALPIMLGRSVFRLFAPQQVHDGYSLVLGFYLLVACYLCGRAVDRLDKRRQRRSPEGPRADLRILVIKRGLLWLAKISYMMVTLGVILPILVALVMDLYVILPVRLALDPTMNPRIRIVDAWALGLLYVKIAFHVHRIQPNTRISRGLQHIVAHGWLRPDPIAATKEMIAPIGGGLLGMILLPGALFRALQQFFPGVNVDDKFVFMHIYPGIFVVAGLTQSSRYVNEVVASWSQTVRDKEFLVEMRLRNHEPQEEAPKEKTAVP